MVPANCFISIPLFLAKATYNANNIKLVENYIILNKKIPIVVHHNQVHFILKSEQIMIATIQRINLGSDIPLL